MSLAMSLTTAQKKLAYLQKFCTLEYPNIVMGNKACKIRQGQDSTFSCYSLRITTLGTIMVFYVKSDILALDFHIDDNLSQSRHLLNF